MLILAKVMDHSVLDGSRTTNSVIALARPCQQKEGQPTVKLVRTIVGPPGGLDWSAPWPDHPHEWNARIVKCGE